MPLINPSFAILPPIDCSKWRHQREVCLADLRTIDPTVARLIIAYLQGEVLKDSAAMVATLRGPGTPNPDKWHCDDCGVLIDSAQVGCQSADDGNGCRGFDYRRDVCGIDGGE